jgi:hypothetical protein
MTIEKVIWTSLPYGLTEDGRLKITLHLAPRLSNADLSDTIRKLGEFPAFSSWPDRLASLEFRVEFDNGLQAHGVPLSELEPELWQRVFPPETSVKPFAFKDHAARNLHIFPVRGVLQFLKTTYGELGAAGSEVPSIDDLTGPLAPFGPLEHLTNRITDSQSFYEELYRSQQGEKGDGKVVWENVADSSLPYHQQAAQNDFFQAYRFYYRPGSQRPDLPADYIEPSPDVPEFDFHQMVASLADFPDLLRRLGLIVDLVVDLPDPHQQLPSEGIVWTFPEGELPEDPPTSPGTRYILDGRWFAAKPKDPFRLSRGLLRLSPEVFDLFQVDVDGAALQVAGFANTLGRMRNPERRSEATPSEATVPALRSAGLALARTSRGDLLLEDLQDRREKNTRIEAGLPVVFDAEDLVRGYRIDVYDDDAADGGRWFSLHARVSKVLIKDTPDDPTPVEIEVIDEGYVKGTSATSERADHPNASDDLYLHETVFGWEGWSLAAPRPGKRVVEPGEGDDGSTIARYAAETDSPVPVTSQSVPAPGTLPRLRIGHTYRLRARRVDLAGNSRPFREGHMRVKEPDLMSEAQRYLRFEPVPSPTVLRRHLDTEGESLEHLVVRSNLGVTAADYAASPEVVQALLDAGVPHAYSESSQRHLAPPKSSQLMAEQDGRFEVAFGGTPAQVTTALRVALREEGTYLDETIVDTATGQKTINQSAIALHPQGTLFPANRGDGLPGGAYAYYPDPSVLLPYLPDPLAVGVSVTGYDHTGAEVFHHVAPFQGNWPELAPFRLRLAEGPLGVAFQNNILEVQLPKAEVVKARLASVLPDGRLGDMAVWGWIPELKRTELLKSAALEGRHWMLTPFRLVTFTHAVQQPLVVPDTTKIIVARALGSTYAAFRGPILNHAKSTGRLDIYGEWTEDIDLLTDDEPRMRAFGTEVSHQAQAFGFDIGPGEDQAQAAISGPVERISRHEFGDTKYRRIVYHSVATTRFREYLPRPIAEDPDSIQRVEPAVGQDGETNPGLVRHIPNSARPAAPDVLYVLPTFRWERGDEGDQRVHTRRGKAVRVWMRRPWFSSGDGEQLGVVLEPGVRLPRGWRRFDDVLELAVAELAARPPHIRMAPLRADAAAASAAPIRALQADSSISASLAAAVEIGEKFAFGPPPPTPEQIHNMLRPYVTAWGMDPVWKSVLPLRPPTVADFPRHAGYAAGLTLEELHTSVKVVVAGHEVHFDRQRKLWYCDIEINPGDTYYPFVRLALARYQPHSLPNAHLSRVVMSDFIQLAPDRTAQVDLAEGAAAVTVKGFSGRNIVADLGEATITLDDVIVSGSSSPNTTMRAALERKIPGVPGDLGWERVGGEVTLQAKTAGFHVTWTGAVGLPEGAVESGEYRLVVTEAETYLRDLIPGDPNYSTSPVDFVRERVVYADIFEL